jgi:general secretion pathway protein E/type IV pilus assembly protein PilB
VKNSPLFVDSLIYRACILDASDIHIDPKLHFSEVRFRVCGEIILDTLFTSTKHEEIVSRIKVVSKLRIDIHEISQDGRFIFEHKVEGVAERVDVRVSIVPTFFGENIVLRLLRQEKYRDTDLDTLGLTKEQQMCIFDSLKRKSGMILISGPTGSGKTTTIYGLIRLLIAQGRNIVTIEDPVEYVIPEIRQIQISEHLGFGFSNALRSIVRQDPDVIVVGEIRDDITAKLAFQSALTGHLVISTIHSEDSASVYARLSQLGVPKDLCNSLILLISQRLLSLRDFFDSTLLTESKGVSGSKSRSIQRVGVFEVIPVIDTQKVTLFQNTFPEYIRRALQKQGVLLLEDRIREISNTYSNLYTHG